MELIQYRRHDADGARPPAADRATLHQQVLHHRPSAGELVREVRRRAGAIRRSSFRGATCTKQHGHLTWDDYIEQGVLTAMREITEIARSTRSTYSASASAEHCSPLRSPCLPPAATIVRERDVAHDDARLP